MRERTGSLAPEERAPRTPAQFVSGVMQLLLGTR